MSGSGCTGLTCTKSTPSIPKTRATRTTPLSDPRRQWLLDVNSNQGLRISAGEASVSGVPPGCNVTAFTAFTAFQPTDHEDCQDGSPLGGRLLWGDDISALMAQMKAVKPVKPVLRALSAWRGREAAGRRLRTRAVLTALLRRRSVG